MTAHAVLGVGDVLSCGHPVTASLSVYPPGQTHAQPAFISVKVCLGAGAPMGVGHVGSGAGIPDYTFS